MPTKYIYQNDNDLLIVGAVNHADAYILWQASVDDPDAIHFEYNDQINGGYNIVKEISIMRDGIHIVLTSEKTIHFYFGKENRKDLVTFMENLRSIYKRYPDVIEVYLS